MKKSKKTETNVKKTETNVKKDPTETYVEKMSDQEIVTICNEIYNWKYVTGCLDKNSLLRNKAKNLEHVSSSMLSRYVLDEAANRFGNLVVLLMANKPYKFLQFSK